MVKITERIIPILMLFALVSCTSTRTRIQSDDQGLIFVDSSYKWGAYIIFEEVGSDSIPFQIATYSDICVEYISKIDPQYGHILIEHSDGVYEIKDPDRELTGYDTTLLIFYNGYAKLKREGETIVTVHMFPENQNDSVEVFQQEIKIRRINNDLVVKSLFAKNEEDVFNRLINKIEADSVYSSWTSIECLQFDTIEDTETYIVVNVREKHTDDCPGDTLFTPRVDTFKIFKNNFEIFWYNLSEDKYEPYSVFLRYRKH